MQFNTLESARVSGSKALRSGGIGFRYLLEGTEFALDNYQLSIVTAENYSAPRHRHNFEQIRVLLEGEFGFDNGLRQTPGSIGYFCEGTYYTQDAQGLSRTLLLQVAGPSAQSYMSERQLNLGIDELKRKGEFHEGVFTWYDSAGIKHNQDAYEAVREHAFGEPVRYPKPRYEAPVIFRPERFDYVPEGDVQVKHLGTFHERSLSCRMVRAEAGTRFEIGHPLQTQLVYCIGGLGQVEQRRWTPGSAFEVLKATRSSIEVEETSEFLVFSLPWFD